MGGNTNQQEADFQDAFVKGWLPEDVEDWMADCAAIFHTQPSEMDDWDLIRLYRWRKQAETRSGNNDD